MTTVTHAGGAWVTDRRTQLSLGFSLLAVVLGIFAIAQLHERMLTIEDLSALLTPLWMGAVAAACVAAVVAIKSGSRVAGWSAIGVFIWVLHTVPVVAWPLVRMNTTWYHAGLAAYLADGGAADPALDIRYNWPAVFYGIGWVSRITGAATIDIAYLWPVAIQIGLALLTYALARSLRLSARTGIASAILITILSVTGQNYMSPQSVTLLMFVGVMTLAAKLSRYGSPRFSSPSYIGLFAAIVALAALMSLSHEYTFVVLFGSLLLLVATWRDYRGLWPVLLSVAVIGGLQVLNLTLDPEFMSQAMSGTGNPAASVNKSIVERVRGLGEDPLRSIVLTSRVVLGLGGIAVATALGWINRKRVPGFRPLIAIIIAATVAGLAIPYGGESLIRAFLFASIPASVIGGWLLTRKSTRTWLVAVVIAAIVVVAVPARWGNESLERFSTGLRGAVQWVEDNTEDSDRVIVADQALPARAERPFALKWYFPPDSNMTNPDWLYATLTGGVTGNGYVINSELSGRANATLRGQGDNNFEVLSTLLAEDPRFQLVAGDSRNQVWGVAKP